VIGATQRVTFAGTDAGRDGVLTVVFGCAMVALGIVIMVRQGRLWVGIVGIVIAAVTVLIALADLGDVAEASDRFRALGVGHVDTGPGLIVVFLAAWAGLGASIVAVAVRRP
jgi:hypothetical protein